MRDALARGFKRVGYAFLSATVVLREAWLRWKQGLQDTWRSFIASTARIQPFTAWFSSGRHLRRAGRGSTPKTPTVLGAVVIESRFGIQEDQALARLVAWAKAKNFRQVILYDPAGQMQDRKQEINEALRWVDPGGVILVWSGWDVPPGFNLTTNTEESENTGKWDMGLALLSAADVEEPLAKAAASGRRADAARELTGQHNEAALEAAVAASNDVKARLMAASGPLAGIEPDLVVVFGSAFTMAGFPPWAVRTAELFEVGPLGAVTAGKMDAVLRKYLGIRQRFGR